MPPLPPPHASGEQRSRGLRGRHALARHQTHRRARHLGLPRHQRLLRVRPPPRRGPRGQGLYGHPRHRRLDGRRAGRRRRDYLEATDDLDRVSAWPPAPTGADASAPCSAIALLKAVSTSGMYFDTSRSCSGPMKSRRASIARAQPGATTRRARLSMPASTASTATDSGYVLPSGPFIRPRRMPPAGLASPPATMSVAIQEKYATPTSTPLCRISLRSESPNASTPALAAEYADMTGP